MGQKPDFSTLPDQPNKPDFSTLPDKPKSSGGFGSGYGIPSLRDITTTAAKIPTQLGETLVGLGDIVTAPVRKGLDAAGLPNRALSTALKEEFGYDPKVTKAAIDSFKSPELTTANKKMADARGVGEVASVLWENPGLAILAAEESLPYLAGGAGIARGAMRAAPALGRIGAGMIGEGTIGAGSQAAQIREEKGDFTPSDALIATGSGAVTAATSGVSGKVAKGLGLPDIDAMLADKTVKGVRRIPALFGGGVTEAAEEALQSGQERGAVNLATGKPIGQGVSEAATTGGVTGGLMGGTIPMFRRTKDRVMSADTSAYEQQELPFDQEPQQQTLIPHPIDRFDELSNLGVRTPEQATELDELRQQLGADQAPTPLPPGIDPFTKKFRKIATEDPTQQSFDLQPQTDEQGQMSLFGSDSFTLGDPSTEAPNVGPPSQMEVKVLDSPYTREDLLKWRSEGWTLAGDQNGYPTMVRRGGSPDRPITRQDLPGPVAGNEVAIGENGDITWPGTPSPDIIQTVESQGFKFDSLTNTFKKLMSGESGEFDPGQMWQNLKSLLGRDPTPAEVEQGMSRQVRPGEQTGRVADFEPKGLRESFSNDELLQYAEHFRQQNDNPHLLKQLENELIKRGINPATAEVPPIRGPLYKGWDWNDSEPPYEASKEEVDAMMAWKPPIDDPDMPGSLDRMWNDSPAYGLHPLMADRIEKVGSRDWDFTPQEPQEQPQLPMLHEAPESQTIDADAVSRIRAQAMDRLSAPYQDQPRQLSMMDDMADQEIADYLRNEDARPPEMTDLGPSQMSAPEDWEGAKSLAEDVGVDWRNYDDIEDLYRAINTEVDRASKEIFDQPEIPQDTGGREMLERIFRDNDNTDIPWPPKEGDSPEMAALKQQANDFHEYSKERDLSPEQEAEFLRILDKIHPEGGVIPSSPSEMSDDSVRMEIGDRIPILRNMQGSYAEHGARVANKELLQNAIDETPAGGTVSVTLDYQGATPSITVEDNGPGIPLDVLKNEYITLTGSGKRGKTSHTGRKTIGEMGVGKATYLLGTDRFEITTTAREADGTIWRYELSGNPDAMIGEDTAGNPVPPVDIVKTQMPANTSTGTIVQIFDSNKSNITAAENYLETFAKYSSSPVTVVLKGNRFPHSPSLNINETVLPRTVGVGQHVVSGSGPGADYSIYVPDNAGWQDNATSLVVVINNRGMFQGAETIYPGGRGRIPDRVVVNIEPTVSAQDAKNYPLTSPTRERMKGPFNAVITKAIKEHIMQSAEKKRQADIQAAYDGLVPQPNPSNPGQPLSFVTNDRGGRYTSQEIDDFNSNPRVQEIGEYMGDMLSILDSLFPTEQKTKTVKHGFDLADVGNGGVNIPNMSNPQENAILVNLHSALHDGGGDPVLAAELFTHTVLHEFTHNLAREEGAGFTWAFRKTDSRFGTDRRASLVETISKLIGDPSGGYAPDISKLLQDHTAARGRSDSTIDFIARQEEGRFLERPGQDGVSGNDRNDRGRTARVKEYLRKFMTDETGAIPVEDHLGMFGRFSRNMGWGEGGSRKLSDDELKGIAKEEQMPSFAKEAWNFPTGATTTLDYSGPGRQGISQVFTRDFWNAAGKMFKGGWSTEAFDKIDAELKKLPIHQEKVDRNTGKALPTVAQDMGIKLMAPGHRGGPREEFTAGRWLESGSFLGGEKLPFTDITNPLAAAWKHSIGRPIRGSNRAFTTFNNVLRSNRAQRLMDLAADMSTEGLTMGRAPMPGIMGGMRLPGIGQVGFKQNYSPQEALDLNPYYNKQLAREIGDFVNTATGRGPLKTHWLPHKNREVSVEKAADILGNVLFSPRNLASKIRMLNPNTYIMASPFVRKQYMKAALSSAAAWFTFAQLAKNAGDDDDVQVSSDPTNSDFGKIRIGDTRLDPGAGFQQFLVLLARTAAGGYTSSVSDEFHAFGEGYNPETLRSTVQRFGENKLNPATKFIYDLIDASEYKPFNLGDRTLQMATPLMLQDLIGILKQNPEMLPWMMPVIAGWGTQTYDKDENPGRLIPSEYDRVIEGGGPLQWMGIREPGSFEDQ